LARRVLKTSFVKRLRNQVTNCSCNNIIIQLLLLLS
jgi:hypothetical protein